MINFNTYYVKIDSLKQLKKKLTVYNIRTMPRKYICQICDSTSTQLSHHKTHLGTQKHVDKKKIFEMELLNKEKTELLEKYKSDNVEKIIKKMEKKIIQIVNKKIKLELVDDETKTEEPTKKKISGKQIWNIDQNTEVNENYYTIKSKLESVIKQCHNLLYSNGSIVGIKAQNDIMRILCIKILEQQFNDAQSSLYKKCFEVKDTETISEEKFEKYFGFCQDIGSLALDSDPLRSWMFLNNNFLTKILPAVYYRDDEKFNCRDTHTLSKIIISINSLEINKDFQDAFSTTCGDIHEAFRSYGGGKGAKELGQYFTPRHLIHLMFHGLGLDSYVQNLTNKTIYDPCMGTGGFLTRLYKLCDGVESSNIYGCETEIDTIKFGEMSITLTTGDISNNVTKCDSITQNPFIVNKKFGAIVTNPPFGTKMNYKDLKNTFEDMYSPSEYEVKFEDVYPLKINNGAALFVQHCVYMLDKGGVCAIVLPDGELFEGNSKWSRNFRQWLCKKVNIRTILKVPGGTFEHAGVKTNVVIFTNDGPTEKIHFVETTKECNEIKEMFSISMDDLKSADYTMDIGAYVEQFEKTYEVPMVKLGDVCEINYGTRITKKNNKSGKYPVYGSGEPTFTTEIFNRSGITTIIGRFALSKKCVRIIKNRDIFLNDSGLSIHHKNNISQKYISLYLLFNQDIIYNLSRGQAQKNLDMKKFPELKIPLPSLEVQQQIVDELSVINEHIETLETRISQLKKEKEMRKKYSYVGDIRELVKDCEIKKLRDVCEIIYGNRNEIVTDNTKKFPSISGGSKISKYTNQWNIRENTILIARSGSCGSVNMFNEKCLMGSYGYFLKIKTNNIINTYAYNYLRFNQSLIEKLAKGSSVKNLNRDDLYNFKIPLPSLEIQQQCIEIYQKKERELQMVEDQIKETEKMIESQNQLAKEVIIYHC